VVFMDLRLKIADRRITTSLYTKPMTLHLYLPPHSCHAPGVLSGLVFGNVLCIHQLCSNAWDIMLELKLLLCCLLDWGYQLIQLTPLFQKAIDNAKAYPRCMSLDPLWTWSKKEAANCQQVFLHLPYQTCQPLFQCYPETLGESRCHAPRPTSSELIDQWTCYSIPI
jgi:hypothetical protein